MAVKCICFSTGVCPMTARLPKTSIISCFHHQPQSEEKSASQVTVANYVYCLPATALLIPSLVARIFRTTHGKEVSVHK